MGLNIVTENGKLGLTNGLNIGPRRAELQFQTALGNP